MHNLLLRNRLAAIVLMMLCCTQISKAQISCNAPTFAFYGLGNVFNDPNGVHQSIYKLEIAAPGAATVDTNNEILGVPNVNMTGLAIADLGNGLSFYSSSTNFSQALDLHTTVHRYDGSAWSVSYVDSLFPFSTNNIAGNGAFLYFHNSFGYSSSSAKRPGVIRRFTGSGFTTLMVDSTDTVSYTVRDIAVDDSGNIYYFTGNDTSNRAKTTHLKVMSPAGVLLQNVPIVIDSPNLAGCFFQNNTLWIHAAGSNVVNPYMRPITLSGSSLTLGAMVSIPRPLLGYRINPNNVTYSYLAFDDMASCTNTSFVVPTGVLEKNASASGLAVYPNPASGAFSVRMPTSGNYSIQVFNALGQCCYTAQTQEAIYTIPCSHFSKGLYHIRVSSAEKEYASCILID